ncbi:MAG TPA: response regulator [Opitutaceae bacterium]|nr:response regulator [Opitutaceae bacterium]
MNDTSTSTPFDSGPVNILLVDDEPRNLDVLESSLQSPDYKLVRALTAERALLLLLEGEFAAIVLDIQMPDMNGIELANLIKQRRRTQHIPIIFLTAYFQEDKDVLEGYGSGAVDYLTKPINPQILRSKIAVFVDLFRKTRALAASNLALEQEIAQRLKAEESLRRINSTLESHVHARTADLVGANEELRARGRALLDSEMRVQRELEQQKRIEAQLRASEEQLRLVTDHAPVFITQFDREHRFKFVNRTYARRFGMEPQELVGKHFSEVMGQEPYVAIREHIDAALAGKRVEFEAEIAYASLGPRWVYVIHEPERTAEGEVVGFMAVITDITDRKLAEQEVAAARDKALAASRTKDDFLARLSHELRTPLNPVLLLASDAVNNSDLPAAVRADFEMIAENVMLEARLIDDLLDLTAITRGKVALKMRPVQVHSVLNEALTTLRQDFAQKDLALNLRLESDKHIVTGDDVRLKQIFWNVLKNAIKFTPPGGQIAVETKSLPKTNKLLVTVSDTGIGMTEEEIARIFSAFTQGDHAAQGSARFGGLGLGLVIAQTLVQLHSGTIMASSPGRDLGAKFAIELPLSADKAVASPSLGVAPLASGDKADKQDARRILLIEDHKPTCRALEDLLVRRNYKVTTANTATEAREKAENENFDFVVSDIGLPDGNGCDLMKEFRTRYGLEGIALTGYGMDEDMGRSRAAGFITHLTKPVSVQALDKALSHIVSLKRRPLAPAQGSENGNGHGNGGKLV